MRWTLLWLAACGHPLGVDSGDGPDSGPAPDVRPPNPTCLAPDRPAGDAAVVLERAFHDRTFARPVGLFPVPGAEGDWVVIEQAGDVLRFSEDDPADATAVASFPDVVMESGEEGLLGWAFHPEFADNGVAFASYTAKDGAQLVSRIVRVHSADGGRTFDTAAPELILEIDQPYANHNGGNIAFGPDGYLYAGYGDGGSAGDPKGNGQNVDVLLGKMLRVDVDSAPPYGIPADNPFAAGGGAPEIYAWGLRNPWRWAFDAATGELWVGDVGQNLWEELDLVERGGNYGWDTMEGTHCYGPGACDPAGLILPLAEYPHDEDGRGSITGGPVYRGSRIPGLVGVPLFAEVYSGTVYGLLTDPKTGERAMAPLAADTGALIVSFGQAPDGEVYAVAYTGELYALAPASEATPDPLPATLSATGCVDPADATQPVAALFPYDVTAPLWSDGAEKARWFAIPDGTTATVTAGGTLDLPIGSVVVKEFRLGDRRVETRLLVRHEDGDWAGYTYAWNEAGTDATLLPAGAVVDVDGQAWTYPSRGQCLGCHTTTSDRLLGLTLAQLDPADVARWTALGVLDPGDATATPLVDPAGDAPVDERARAYLDANCAHCHQPGGTGLGALDLRAEVALADTHACGVEPEHGDLGVPGARIVDPGHPETSVLSLRMAATDAHRMPAYGTTEVDPAGTALVDAWIRSIPACD